jgi:hypothetical protein
MLKKSKSIMKKDTTLFDFLVKNYASIFVSLFLLIFLYNSYREIPYLDNLFTMPKEPPWLPDGIQPIALMGQHYFGDFQLPYVMANQSNPYSTGNVFNNILPLGYAILLFLGNFSLHVAMVVNLSFTLIVYFFAFYLLQNRFGVKSGFFQPFILLNMPLLWALDRAAAILLIAPLFVVGYCLVAFNDGTRFKNHSGYIILAFCISAKIYLLPAIILLVIGSQISRSKLSWITAYFITGNFLTSFLFTGPIDAFKQIYFSLNATTDNDFSNVRSDFSINFAHNIVLFANQFNFPWLVNKSILSGVGVFCFLVSAIIVYTHKSREISLVMSLSMIQYFASVSFMYTSIWTIFALILLIKSPGLNDFRDHEVNLFRFMIVVLIVHLLPLPRTIWWISSLGWFLILVLMTLQILRRRKSKTNVF